jgi:hypothetical protein
MPSQMGDCFAFASVSLSFKSIITRVALIPGLRL